MDQIIKTQPFARSRHMFRWTALIVFILGLYALKLFYASAKADDLRWILGPTAAVVGLCAGIPFFFLPEIGYLSADGAIVINESCAGVNFLILCLTVTGLNLWPAFQGGRRFLAQVVWSMALCGLLTVLANSSRIMIALTVDRALGIFGGLSEPEWMHQAIGAFVYGAALISYHLILRRLNYGRRI